MKNSKIVAKGLAASIVIAVLTGIFQESLTVATANSLYAIAGIGYLIFGTWAAKILW